MALTKHWNRKPAFDRPDLPESWRRPMWNRPFWLVALATLAASLIAVYWQHYDIRISELFYEPGQGFPVAREPFFMAIRRLGQLLPVGVVAALLATVAVRLARRAPFSGLSDRALAFLGLCFAIGPGLIVNLILKSHWGRARPVATDVFGGKAPFTPAWLPSNSCTESCASFVSGEASTAMVLIAFAFVAPKAWRPAIVAACVIWTIVISLNRVAFGAHYLSDVVIASGLTLLVVFALKALMLDGHGDGD